MTDWTRRFRNAERINLAPEREGIANHRILPHWLDADRCWFERTTDGTVSACQDEDPDELLDLIFLASEHYLNVHTEAYPAGAVRGQLDAGFGFEELEETAAAPVDAAGLRKNP